MEIIGKIVHLLPLITGQGRNGEWRKQEFVIDITNEGGFSKKACFSLWGEKIDQAGLILNENVKVHFDIESREYNSRWFTEARAWRVEKQPQTTNDPVQAQSPQIPTEPMASFNESPVSDDLPF